MVCVVLGQESRTDPRFEEVLYYFDWWDCPRSGVCEIEGVLTRFDSRFSEELDDYPPEFLLWPATDAEVAQGLELWRAWAAWRTRFDRGKRTPAFEETETGGLLVRFKPSEPPANAKRAVPEWKLDANRSFAERVPRHLVRWRAQP